MAARSLRGFHRGHRQMTNAKADEYHRPTGTSLLIRPATEGEANGIWSVNEPTIRAGETYALSRDMTKGEALAYWMGPDRFPFVAVNNLQFLGTYYLRPAQSGGGDHIANCGYITALEARSRGVARQMCEHSLS